jgi:hypothetical protein
LKNLIAVMGAETDGTFPPIIEEAAKHADSLRVISLPYAYVGPVSDHAAFSKAGQPFLFLSCGQGRHYHKPSDTMDWINFDKLAHITRLIGDIVQRIDRTPTNADRSRVDPFDIEIRMLRKALGPIIITGLRAYGIKIPKARAELDQLVCNLMDGKPLN